MKKQNIVIVMAALACFGTRVANAQYPPPPPYYYQPYYPPPGSAPPPMAPPPQAPPPVYYVPSDSGPFFRMGIGPSFYQNGTLQQFGGPANASVKYDVGFLFDAGIGYAINKYVSLDFDTGYTYAGISSVSGGYYTSGSYIDNVPFMGEVVFSLPIPHTILVPYIGAGIGGSSSEFYSNQFGNNANGYVYGSGWDTVLAWEGTAGVRFQVSHNFSAGVAYRYFGTENTTYSYYDYFYNQNFNVGFKGIQSHTVLFTLQWNFW